jgi:hypothetical protein
MHLRNTRAQLHLFVILALALPLAAIYAQPWLVLQAAPPASPESRPPAVPDDARAAYAYIPATGHNIGLAIKRFHQANGGLAIFGLPLTELMKRMACRCSISSVRASSCTPSFRRRTTSR